MKKKIVLVAAMAIVLSIMPMPLFAHHGTSVFDMSKTLTLKGLVTAWDWSNPHCLLQFDVKNNDDGQVVHWIAETQNPGNMVYAGWAKASFKPGDEVTVTLVPAKNGKPFGRINQVVLPNGKTLDADKGAPSAHDSTGPSSGSKSDNYPK